MGSHPSFLPAMEVIPHLMEMLVLQANQSFLIIAYRLREQHQKVFHLPMIQLVTRASTGMATTSISYVATSDLSFAITCCGICLATTATTKPASTQPPSPMTKTLPQKTGTGRQAPAYFGSKAAGVCI